MCCSRHLRHGGRVAISILCDEFNCSPLPHYRINIAYLTSSTVLYWRLEYMRHVNSSSLFINSSDTSHELLMLANMGYYVRFCDNVFRGFILPIPLKLLVLSCRSVCTSRHAGLYKHRGTRVCTFLPGWLCQVISPAVPVPVPCPGVK